MSTLGYLGKSSTMGKGLASACGFLVLSPARAQFSFWNNNIVRMKKT